MVSDRISCDHCGVQYFLGRRFFFHSNKIKCAVFIFCTLFIAWRLAFVPVYGSGKARNSVRGDSFSVIKTHGAALFFQKYGFVKTCFLPYHEYDPQHPETYSPEYVYTHFPPGPQIVAGVVAVLTGTQKDWPLRLVPAGLSLFLFFLIFFALKTILPDPRAALIGSIVIVLSNYYLAWADALNEPVYEELSRWGALLLLYLYYEKQKTKYLWMACGLYFFAVNFSLTVILYLGVLAVGMEWIYHRRVFSIPLLCFVASGAAGVGLHFIQNALFFGSVEGAVQDLLHSGAGRLGGARPEDISSVSLFSQWLKVPLVWLQRIERYFLIPGFAMILFCYWGLKRLKQESQKHYELFWVLLVATLTWSVFLTQHFLEHHFTARHAGVLIGFIAGYGVLAYQDLLRRTWKTPMQKGLHVLFLLYVIGMALTQQVWSVYLESGFLYSAS